MNWNVHIAELKRKCLKSVNIIKLLSHVNWGPNRKILLRINNSCIRLKIDYGSIMYDTASISTKNKLNTIQTQAVRLCLGAYRTSPAMSLLVESSTLPLQLKRDLLTLSYYYARYSEPLHPNNYKLVHSKISNALTLGNRSRHLMQHLQLKPPATLQPPINDRTQQLAKEQNNATIKDDPSSKLQQIKTDVNKWSTADNQNRRIETILARLRIGHSAITHGPLLEVKFSNISPLLI